MVITDRINNCHEFHAPFRKLTDKISVGPRMASWSARTSKVSTFVPMGTCPFFDSFLFRFYCKRMDRAITSGNYPKYNQVLTLSCVLSSLDSLSGCLPLAFMDKNINFYPGCFHQMDHVLRDPDHRRVALGLPGGLHSLAGFPTLYRSPH